MSVILNPLGHPATKREIRITDARIAKFAAFADDVFKQLDAGVVCARCAQPLRGNNATTDTQWKLECACTVRVLRNPEVQ